MCNTTYATTFICLLTMNKYMIRVRSSPKTKHKTGSDGHALSWNEACTIVYSPDDPALVPPLCLGSLIMYFHCTISSLFLFARLALYFYLFEFLYMRYVMHDLTTVLVAHKILMEVKA